jgi:hypothetical protein
VIEKLAVSYLTGERPPTTLDTATGERSHKCTLSGRKDDDGCSWLHLIEQIDDILVRHSDAPG